MFNRPRFDDVYPSGTTILGPDASIEYLPGAMRPKEGRGEYSHMFGALWARRPAPRRNPMNKSTFLKRMDGFFTDIKIDAYKFGSQKSACMGTIEDAPVLVRRFVEFVQAHTGKTYTAAHVNFYPGGDAGVSAHRDEDPVDDHDIWSCSFYEDDSTFRPFVISADREQKDVVAVVHLFQGDVVAMKGRAFQDKKDGFWHSLITTQRKEFADKKRINITLRMWKPAPGGVVRG
jgi:alkylated DNA repair dioxygenase AlkB